MIGATTTVYRLEHYSPPSKRAPGYAFELYEDVGVRTLDGIFIAGTARVYRLSTVVEDLDGYREYALEDAVPVSDFESRSVAQIESAEFLALLASMNDLLERRGHRSRVVPIWSTDAGLAPPMEDDE